MNGHDPFKAAINSLKAKPSTLFWAKLFGRKIVVHDELGVTVMRKWRGVVYMTDFAGAKHDTKPTTDRRAARLREPGHTPARQIAAVARGRDDREHAVTRIGGTHSCERRSYQDAIHRNTDCVY